jgi:hypothetical protein
LQKFVELFQHADRAARVRDQFGHEPLLEFRALGIAPGIFRLVPLERNFARQPDEPSTVAA